MTDQQRADAFIKELAAFEKQPGDAFPELSVMALSTDHTVGTRPGMPTPAAMVADNDLALGRMLAALSKSRFWKNTVVFVTEDDSLGRLGPRIGLPHHGLRGEPLQPPAPPGEQELQPDRPGALY
ncbi:MAG: hypothetical protein WKG07_42315 [Hymenobacter sp.]